MNQKTIGLVIIIFSLFLAIFVAAAKDTQDKQIDMYIMQEGTCYLEDGTCLHQDTQNSIYFIGWILSAIMMSFGIYLLAFDSSKKILENQERISSQLVQVKEEDKKKDEFKAFLSAFSEDKQKILRLIHDHEGITQSTLRFKSSLSKAHLSGLVRELEKENHISRKVKGKTYELYLVKNF